MGSTTTGRASRQSPGAFAGAIGPGVRHIERYEDDFALADGVLERQSG
ncbi:MAG: hypothetical protein FJZ00_05050 [Candidatus Sericytochromatia bacterium]|uniref:Uncharacterized protein n=1 Tax=Candidatus Tanganyikabacteria bacterium TaxID=2961651 RepID=A0A937X527_9BACT|nr:hypothetical protein [Candidatus Tanganyikabacteria bacterium]